MRDGAGEGRRGRRHGTAAEKQAWLRNGRERSRAGLLQSAESSSSCRARAPAPRERRPAAHTLPPPPASAPAGHWEEPEPVWLSSRAADTPDLPPPNEPASGGGTFGARPRLQACPAAESRSREKKPSQSPACPPTEGGAGDSWPRPRCQVPPPPPSCQPLGGGARGALPGSASLAPALGSGP